MRAGPILLVTLCCLCFCPISSPARTFTDTHGRTFEGEVLSATDETVEVRRRDGRRFTLRLEILSQSDREAVREFRAASEMSSASAEAERNRVAAVKKIVEFATSNIGKQVGDGECWTLANEAFKYSEIRRPSGAGNRVWGREIDYAKEAPEPGDVVEIEGARFSSGARFSGKHTSVVVEVGRRGKITVCEQNFNGDKTVQKRDYDLIGGLKSGTVKLYRYDGG